MIIEGLKRITMVGLLAGKIAAITGGVTGIGRAIVLEYVRQGAKVGVNYFPDDESTQQYESLVAELGTDHANKLIAVPGDVTKPSTGQELVSKTVERYGRLDVFVSNAGVCQFTDFLTMTPELVNSTISTNLNGAVFAVQAAAQQMARQTPQGGSIIGMSSISALVGGAGQTHYTPTKAGVLSLMQSCACALGKYNIRCNALLPGTIRTQLNDEDLAEESKRTYMEGRIPLGRLGQPSDMAGPAVFLASDMSKYMSGSQMLVDGGLFVNLQ
nr:L-rhamnose-1-dehydrogenase [Rachicladosporium sp. CCFEE 5018]